MRSENSSAEGGILNILTIVMLERRRLVELIHSLTGFGVREAEPFSKEIKLILPRNVNGWLKCSPSEEVSEEEGNIKVYDFFRLFRTVPPFEPLFYGSNYSGATFRGDYVWFIKVKEVSPKSYEKLKDCFKYFSRICGVRCDDIICGVYSERGDMLIIDAIVAPRTIADGSRRCRWYKRIVFKPRIESTTYPSVIITYGLEHAKRVLERELNQETRNPIETLDQKRIDMLKKMALNKNIRYDITSINYVNWCRRGFELNADPFSAGQICWGCSKELGKNIICKENLGFGLYSRTRRIFPKVYSNIRTTILKSRKFLRTVVHMLSIPITPIVVRDLALYAAVENFDLYLPQANISVRLTPEKKPSMLLRKSNGLLLLVHEDVVRSFIDALISSPKSYPCELRKEATVPLLDLLLTKYILYKHLHDIINSIDVDEDSLKMVLYVDKKHGDLVKYLEEHKDSIVNSIYFTRYVGDLLMHTLAHVMLIHIVEKLNLRLEDVVYTYGRAVGSDKLLGKSIYYAGVFENNEYGTLHLDYELQRIFKRYTKAFENAIRVDPEELRAELSNIIEHLREFYNTILKENIEELENTASRLVSMIASDVKVENCDSRKVINELIEFFRSSINEYRSKGIILDQSTINHIVQRVLFSNSLRKKIARVLTRKLGHDKVNEKCVNDVLDIITDRYVTEFVLAVEPNYCLDGCKGDIHLERYCSDTLYENLLTSRCALLWFLRFIGIDDYSKPLRMYGEAIQRLVSAAMKSVDIQTAFLNKNAIDSLANLLAKGISVNMRLDIRIKQSSEKYLRDLEELKSRYPRLLNYSFSEAADHGKRLRVDNLCIMTSWNYGTGTKPLQDYAAHLCKDEPGHVLR